MTTRMVLRTELVTPFGIFAAGTEFPAEPHGDDGWMLQLLPTHTVTLAAGQVYPAMDRRQITDEVARQRYRFARRDLRHSPAAAWSWLLEQYGPVASQRERWELMTLEMETMS